MLGWRALDALELLFKSFFKAKGQCSRNLERIWSFLWLFAFLKRKNRTGQPHCNWVQMVIWAIQSCQMPPSSIWPRSQSLWLPPSDCVKEFKDNIWCVYNLSWVCCACLQVCGAPCFASDMHVVTEVCRTGRSNTQTLTNNYKALSMSVNVNISIVVRWILKSLRTFLIHGQNSVIFSEVTVYCSC